MADEDVILASVLTVVALVTARKCRRCNRSCCAIGYCAGQATVTLTKRSLLIFMKFNFVARPYTLATKSNSTVCCGRLCRKWVIFVARMSKFLSSLVASVYGAKTTRSTLSTFDKVDHVEFDFVTTVYRALLVYLFYSGPDLVLPLHLTNC